MWAEAKSVALEHDLSATEYHGRSKRITRRVHELLADGLKMTEVVRTLAEEDGGDPDAAQEFYERSLAERRQH